MFRQVSLTHNPHLQNGVSQSFKTKLLFGLFISFLVGVLTGCSLFEAGPAEEPRIPHDQSSSASASVDETMEGSTQKEGLDATSLVPIKPLVDPKKLTDVTLEFNLSPDSPVEFVVFHFGKSIDTLTNSKKVSKDSLSLVDPTTHLYQYTLKDAGEIRPLFVSIATAAGGFTSEASTPFEVKD